MYDINGEHLKREIHKQGLSIAGVGRSIGFMPNYFNKCINMNRLSNIAVKRLFEIYQINPANYVIGWKGGKEK